MVVVACLLHPTVPHLFCYLAAKGKHELQRLVRYKLELQYWGPHLPVKRVQVFYHIHHAIVVALKSTGHNTIFKGKVE